MKKCLLQLALIVTLGLAGLGLCPQPAAASLNAPRLVEQVKPAPAVTQPTVKDFADGEFEQADQPELGSRIGGDAGGLIIFILVVVLLVLLIMWLLNSDGGHRHVIVSEGTGAAKGEKSSPPAQTPAA